MELLEAYAKIEAAAEKPATETRVLKEIKPGQGVRQGDIYIVATHGLKPGKRLTQRQLAPGETQGSRHIAEAPAQIFESPGHPIPGIQANALLGPLVEADQRWNLAHPEHAHASFPPGQYQVVYQLDFAAQRRVQD
jgi:hypothetical protein